MEIRPEGLNVNDYHFMVKNQNGETKLDKIIHRQLNVPVVYQDLA